MGVVVGLRYAPPPAPRCCEYGDADVGVCCC